jgi:hypothetical protein
MLRGNYTFHLLESKILLILGFCYGNKYIDIEFKCQTAVCSDLCICGTLRFVPKWEVSSRFMCLPWIVMFVWVPSILTLLQNFSSKEALWICGNYIDHLKKLFDMKFSVVDSNIKNIRRIFWVVNILTVYVRAKFCWF